MTILRRARVDFVKRYGPWAVVAGASEGTGRAYAGQLAAKGLNLILIARRSGPLLALADALGAAHGIECVAAAIDLGKNDAHARIVNAVGSRDVGLYVGNAGADPNGSRFLDIGIDPWLDLVRRNVLTTIQSCHHFGSAMRARGRGGMLLVNSYACYGGGAGLACYTASKAFELNFAESLWDELRPHGVDVMTLIMGMTDTPAYRKMLAEKGLALPTEWASAEDVAAFGLAHLADGPIQNWGIGHHDAGFAPQSAADRLVRLKAIGMASIGGSK
jgi:short-subunit dehydrogenase